MNYRHAFHAGNFADVVKHLALVSALLHLRKKQTSFAVIDSHAGRGLYDLAAEAARRTGEAAGGIERLRGISGPATPAVPEALETYLALTADDRYPGSPLIAARLLRPQDRLVAVEKHPEDAAALKAALGPFARARAVTGDGYGQLTALLPPPERRGLVLIDPPFEAADEFALAAAALGEAWRRFATGIYLLWYPVKSPGAARAFLGEALARAAGAPALTIEIAVAAGPEKLARAGLLVVNPPYRFDEEMRTLLDLVAPRLDGGTYNLERLAG